MREEMYASTTFTRFNRPNCKKFFARFMRTFYNRYKMYVVMSSILKSREISRGKVLSLHLGENTFIREKMFSLMVQFV